MLRANITLLPELYLKGLLMFLLVSMCTIYVGAQNSISLDSLCSLYKEDTLILKLCLVPYTRDQDAVEIEKASLVEKYT